MNAPLPIDERQAALEARANQLRGVELGASPDLKSALGAAPEWTMQVGPVRLLLVPFLGQWWFFDEVHGEWRFTGKEIGQARFLSDNGDFRVVEVTGQNRAQTTSDEPPASVRVRRFCSACGAPVQPNWKFCQKCGGKLAALP